MMIASFSSEAELQEWMRTALADPCLITNKLIEGPIFRDRGASSPSHKLVHDSYRRALYLLNGMEVVTDNQNISLVNSTRLRPDFLMWSQITNAYAIVELKNAAKPEREAGTELSAYHAELRSAFPYIPEGDIVNVIVASHWSDILRRHVWHAIGAQSRCILCLQPVELVGSGAKTKKLRIIPPEELLRGITEHLLSSIRMVGYSLFHERRSMYAHYPPRCEDDIHPLYAAVSAVANRGTELKSHGFAFIWRDSSLPYSNVISFMCTETTPSAVAFTRRARSSSKNSFLSHILSQARQSDDDPIIGATAQDLANRLSEFTGAQYNIDIETTQEWLSLGMRMTRRECTPLSFKGWGSFGAAFERELARQYRTQEYFPPPDCPLIGMQVVDQLAVNWDGEEE